MPIPVSCTCGKKYKAREEHAGRSIKCSCGRMLPIPGSRQRGLIVRLLKLLTWAWLAGALGAALLLWGFGDRWWLASLLVYGPRWPLLLPGLVLVPAALLLQRRLLGPQALAALVVLIPVMGLSLGWRGILGGTGDRLRVVTYNIEGLTRTSPVVVTTGLARFEPDIVVMQECPERMVLEGVWPAEWHTGFRRSICIASRYAIVGTSGEERVETGAQGGTGTVVLFRLKRDRDTIDLAVVHLETPRKGLEPLRYGGSAGAMRLNILVRDAGSARASGWIAGHAPEPIIAGDFNLTVESGIYRDHWTRCANAFTQAGRGFGWTRTLKRFSARIDHVLACGRWNPVHAEVGPDLGSDHRPLIADLVR